MDVRVLSKPVWFLRHVFPWVIGLFLAAVLLSAVAAGRREEVLIALCGCAFMSVIFVVVFKVYVWDLAEAVEDHGDHLIAKKGEVEDRIEFTNIDAVSSAMLQNPPRVTIRLKTPSLLGAVISFCPREDGFALFRVKSAIAQDLQVRVDRAKDGSRGPAGT